MDLATLASAAIQNSIRTKVLNTRRTTKLIILSFTSTLLLLGVTIFSSDYLSRTNREFVTKIFLFLTGVSTAATIHLIDKGLNDLSSQTETRRGGFIEPRQSYQINIENYSGTLIDSGVPSNLTRNSSKLLSEKDSRPVESSGSNISEVVVIEPRSFEEVPDAVRYIGEGKSVVLNLTTLDADAAQRAVDFVAGGTYGMKGHQEKIGESMFLFTPQAVSVSGSSMLEQERTSLSTSNLAWTTESASRQRLIDFLQKEEAGEARGDAG